MAILGLLVLFALPALAHHKDGHGKGNGKSARTSEATVTEDNDSDGVPNYPDPEGDSDNKHPSGKDKHWEAGGSGNQGKAASDPDGDSNGGVDQPGGSGGDDEWDQDGNNGCGNDDDFEDDNNGNCGGPERGGQIGGGDVGGGEEGNVGGGAGGGAAGGAVGGEDVSSGGAEVLGISVTRGAGVRGQALAVTGVEVTMLLALALGLMLGGATIVIATRKGTA
jgi:hypothetical protein